MTSARRSAIVLVEDHSLFADALLLALEIDGYMVGRLPLDAEYLATGRFVGAVLGLHPRIVLLDLDLGTQGSGLRILGPLVKVGITVVVVTGETDPVRWGQCIQAGAAKVIGKGTPLSEIRALMHRLDMGCPVMSRAERDELLDLWCKHQDETRDLQTRLDRLSVREAEVLGMLMVGSQVTDIARGRSVSESTVRTQVKAVLGKLQVNSQVAAVGLAHRAHWHPPSSPSLLPSPRRPDWAS